MNEHYKERILHYIKSAEIEARVKLVEDIQSLHTAGTKLKHMEVCPCCGSVFDRKKWIERGDDYDGLCNSCHGVDQG
jgi:hypothetical protein